MYRAYDIIKPCTYNELISYADFTVETTYMRNANFKDIYYKRFLLFIWNNLYVALDQTSIYILFLIFTSIFQDVGNEVFYLPLLLQMVEII